MKERVDFLYSIMDQMIGAINANQSKVGSGLSFTYSLKPEVKKDKSIVYNFSISVREVGHGERVLQTIPYSKPESSDKYNMEFQVMLSVLTIFTESTFIHWNELGKMLNIDSELQNAAKAAKHEIIK